MNIRKDSVKMNTSEIKEPTFSDDDPELDSLLERVKLMEPDSDDEDDGGNDTMNMHDSQVSLFATVRSPTEEPLISDTGLAPDDGGNGVR